MDWLDRAAREAANLDGIVITKLPDCVEWRGWTRWSWSTSDVAAYFGDLVRANRNAMKVVAGAPERVALTIEAPGHKILAQDLRADLVAVYIFNDSESLGAARLVARRLHQQILQNLPSSELVERTRGERIWEFLLRYAPDAHAVPMRVALQTGLTPKNLADPAKLTEAQTKQLEAAAKDILGVDSLGL
ncbi:MAG: hypothetical protein R3F59_15020 [Myxococcota bacterium]